MIDKKDIFKKDILLKHRIEEIMEYIVCLPDEELSALSVSKLAAGLSCNRMHLATIFMEYSKISLCRFIIDTRLNRAMKLLLAPGNNDYSIAEVSHRFGYRYVHYFSRIFKKRFCISPGKLKKLVKKAGIGGRGEMLFDVAGDFEGNMEEMAS